MLLTSRLNVKCKSIAHLLWVTTGLIACQAPAEAQRGPGIITPPAIPIVVSPDVSEPIRCAAGGVKTLRSQGKLLNNRVIVTPILNLTDEKRIQSSLLNEVTHTVGRMGWVAMLPDLNSTMTSASADRRLRGEISVISRVVSASEAESEVGASFGRGYGTGYFGFPKSEKFSFGWVRVVAAVDQAIHEPQPTAYVQTGSHAARSAFWTRSSSKGSQFFVLIQLGSNVIQKQVSGPQDAVAAAAETAIAGALLKSVEIDPSICGL
jgi:hypothetical protein